MLIIVYTLLIDRRDDIGALRKYRLGYLSWGSGEFAPANKNAQATTI